ncbi:Alpha-1,3-mannosyltransferase CMT1 [Tolypocladium paradoxum]|uniref:Alpha-1,3-mannosyltransferase CMT1 n=1 Tax=Tolypocladium paradoxum TaxID=94208 RepID=A0A2S4KL73_9HYPO|nr:Alpha-1,3-mannosyltransferase CMT1 [Tolypocladium paradoxum]
MVRASLNPKRRIFERRTLTSISIAGHVLPAANITTYLDEILGRKGTQLSNFECPAVNSTRYESLKALESQADRKIRYYFALDLRQCLPLLPRLIGSLVEAIRFLGPTHCAISIVEGNSNDGTADVLAALQPEIEGIGATYFLQSSPINPSQGDRIGKLAEIRNMALKPLLENAGRMHANKDTTIVFSNDVALCPDDILELIFQRQSLGADMTCAMDWTGGSNPTFYDVWISRGMNGDSFFDVPLDGSWHLAWNLFWNAEETRARFDAHLPFQVFSCWNGAAVFGAQPVLENILFRGPNQEAGECHQGEPQLFCKDLWFHGFGKIAVVPTVNLEYSIEKGKLIKEAKGFVTDLVGQQNLADDKINWRLEPPEKVKCMEESWSRQIWQLWNETLSM